MHRKAHPTARPNPADSLACLNLQMLRASHYILRLYDEAYRRHGLRATQMPVLGIIARRGPVAIKDIAAETESERSVMSRKLQVMETNGWIREDQGSSGKEKAFVLTVTGRRLMHRIMPVRAEVQARILRGLSRPEQDLLLSLCRKLQGAA